MNRRDLFKRMGLVIAGSVPIGALLEKQTFPTKVSGVLAKGAQIKPVPRGPYDTDDAKYDEILDEMLGEEWS